MSSILGKLDARSRAHAVLMVYGANASGMRQQQLIGLLGEVAALVERIQAAVERSLGGDP